MNDIAIYEWFGVVMPMAEKYKLIKQAGFDAVMMWWGSDELQYDDYLYNPELARKTGLFIENIHTPFERVNNLWLDNQDGENYIASLLRYVNDCAEREIPAMIVHVTNGFNPPPVCELGLERLKILTELAEKKNVVVALENLRRGDYLNSIFEKIDSPMLRFCFDSGHANCYDKNEDYLELYGDKLAAMHLHDNDGKTDLHLAPFEGTVDWPPLMKKLSATRYSGALSLEVFCGDGELPTKDPEELLRIAYSRAKKPQGLI